MISELLLREEVHEVVAEVLLLLVRSSSSVRLDCLLYDPFSARHAHYTATGNAEGAHPVGSRMCPRDRKNPRRWAQASGTNAKALRTWRLANGKTQQKQVAAL